MNTARIQKPAQRLTDIMEQQDRSHEENPGNSASHHFPIARYFMLSDRITPIAGLSEESPKPKNVMLVHEGSHAEKEGQVRQ